MWHSCNDMSSGKFMALLLSSCKRDLIRGTSFYCWLSMAISIGEGTHCLLALGEEEDEDDCVTSHIIFPRDRPQDPVQHRISHQQ